MEGAGYLKHVKADRVRKFTVSHFFQLDYDRFFKNTENDFIVSAAPLRIKNPADRSNTNQTIYLYRPTITTGYEEAIMDR